MGQFIDLIEKRFGRLVVQSLAGRQRVRWNCLCDCGNTKIILAIALQRSVEQGGTRSCGCLQKERASESRSSHRMSASPEYKAWAAVKTRCTNLRQKQWMDYGGRGIKMCDAWLDSFEAFYADIGPLPASGYTVERNDNTKGYEPGNVRWATRTEQQRNKRNSRMITFNGKTQCVSAWAEELNLGSALNQRLFRGWDEQKALSTPLGGTQ